MNNFKNLFNVKTPIIGMIHVEALPGTPNYKGNVKQIISKAIKESKIYKQNGIDAIAIENMHDVPYLKNNAGPEITSLMSIIAYEIKNQTKLPVGIQILAGANKEALAAAHSACVDFIRAEGFVFAHVADEGIIESNAGKILRYRKMIGAENILVFTDIKKKHSSHSITSDITIEETAHTAEFFLSNGLIVTGIATGKEVNASDLIKVRKASKLPIIIGSGITIDNVEKYFPLCDAMIVGSYFKKNGNWQNTVDAERVKSFMKKVKRLRK